MDCSLLIPILEQTSLEQLLEVSRESWVGTSLPTPRTGGMVAVSH